MKKDKKKEIEKEEKLEEIQGEAIEEEKLYSIIKEQFLILK